MLWWPLLGVVNECGDVLSGKRESKNEHLSAYNFSQDTVGNEIGASDIKGRAVFVFAWHYGGKGTLVVVNNRSYIGYDGRDLEGSVYLEPIKVELTKTDGKWAISDMYSLKNSASEDEKRDS